MTREQLDALVWAVVGKIAAKESRRDRLRGGMQHVGKLRIRGTVDGADFDHRATFDLSVAGDVTKNPSQAADQTELLAYFLSFFGPKKRPQICADLVRYFEQRQELPVCEAEVFEEAKSLLQKLRSRGAPQTCKGAVSCTYQLDAA